MQTNGLAGLAPQSRARAKQGLRKGVERFRIPGAFDEPLDGLLRRVFGMPEIYFHEDDYCQQQLLPREAVAYVTAELGKIDEFDEQLAKRNCWTVFDRVHYDT